MRLSKLASIFCFCALPFIAYALPEVKKPLNDTNQPVLISYWANWGVYDGNHPVSASHYQVSGSYDSTTGNQTDYPFFDAQVNALTMLNYAFFEGDKAGTGAIVFSDPWADDRTGGAGSGMGNFIAFNNLKGSSYIHNPNLKLMISIGGWAHGPTFTAAFNNPSNFISSLRTLFNQYANIDGIDLDFEPDADAGGWTANNNINNFVQLVSAVRSAFPDKIITIAAPAAPAEIQAIGSKNWQTLAAALNYINIMAYDFHGAFDQESATPVTAFQSNLYVNTNDPYAVKFSADTAVQAYLAAGVPSAQLVLGVPAYGRVVWGVNDPNASVNFNLFQPFNTNAGILPTLDLGAGVESYHGILSSWLGQGYTDKEDDQQGVASAAWAYLINPAPAPGQGVFVSYDNADTIKSKANYVLKNNLAGMMMWELRDDISPGDPTDVNHASLEYNIAKNLGLVATSKYSRE